jgi:hypothetical protein
VQVAGFGPGCGFALVASQLDLSVGKRSSPDNLLYLPTRPKLSARNRVDGLASANTTGHACGVAQPRGRQRLWERRLTVLEGNVFASGRKTALRAFTNFALFVFYTAIREGADSCIA